MAVVPLSWVTCNTCLWPPKELRNSIMALMEREITASDAWDSYSVKIMGIFGN